MVPKCGDSHMLAQCHAVHCIRRARSGNHAKQAVDFRSVTVSIIVRTASSYFGCIALLHHVEAVCISW